LWYEYACGQKESLIKDVQLVLGKNETLNMDRVIELIKRHLAEDQIVMAEKKALEFRTLLMDMIQHLSRSGNEIDIQGNMLETCAKELEQASSLDAVADIMKQIVLKTKSMVEAGKMLKIRLDETVSEINMLSQELEGIKQVAKTDMLTGLLNRRGLSEAMSEVLEDTNILGEPLSIIMLDIDYFKLVNDTYGHLVGDNVLKMLSKLLKDHIKGKDIAVRFGGEEFILVLPQTSIDGAYALAEHIRTGLHKMKWKIKGTGQSMGQISISLGIALYRAGESLEDVIQRADDALYQAKNTGRNKTVAEVEPEQGPSYKTDN
jgi:diguanylate cyclase